MLNRARAAATSLFLFLTAFPLAAQQLTPANLPADTPLVIYWHGSSRAKAAYANNPVAKIWSSPDYAQFRVQWLQSLLHTMNLSSNGYTIKPTPENTERVLSLIENPMMFGISSSADLLGLAQSASKPNGSFLNSSGLFFVLDTTGKETQFGQLWAEIEAGVSKNVTRSKSEFSGTSVEKFAGPTDSSFAARAGNYFIWSNKRVVIEDLITRQHSGSNADKSLSQDPGFIQCGVDSNRDSLFELFLHVPDLSKAPLPSNPMVDTSAVLKGFKFDAFHAACVSMAITSDGTHTRGLVLADTSAGGIVSIVGANRPRIETLQLVPESAYSFSSGSMDLPAFYKVLRSSAVAAMPPEQQSSVGMVEIVAAAQLGMPLSDALALFGGEYAIIQLDAKTVDAPQLFAITITDQQKILNLIHKFGAKKISDEKQANGVTFLTYGSAPDSVGASGSPIPSQYYVGIAPHFVFASSNPQYVQDAAARLSSPGQSSVADNPGIQELRARLPHDVLGLSIMDYTKVDWANFMKEIIAKSQTAGTPKLSSEDNQFFETMMKQLPWSSMNQTMHWSVGAWWKDADGFHYESNSK